MYLETPVTTCHTVTIIGGFGELRGINGRVFRVMRPSRSDTRTVYRVWWLSKIARLTKEIRELLRCDTTTVVVVYTLWGAWGHDGGTALHQG